MQTVALLCLMAFEPLVVDQAGVESAPSEQHPGSLSEVAYLPSEQPVCECDSG